MYDNLLSISNIKMEDLPALNAIKYSFPSITITDNKHKNRKSYPEDWKEIRAEIIKRDNESCQLCKDTFNLHVHHIDKKPQNCKSSNLITVCHECHEAIHGRKFRF